MKRNRRHFTGTEKVAILRRHLLDSVPISDLCTEYDLQPTVFYRWQKQFFENGAAAFEAPAKEPVGTGDSARIAALEQFLTLYSQPILNRAPLFTTKGPEFGKSFFQMARRR